MTSIDTRSATDENQKMTDVGDRFVRELDDLFDELDTLLKNPEAGAALAAKGVNVSLAMVTADGLRAYLNGDKVRAAEELSTAADEISARLRAAERSKEDLS